MSTRITIYTDPYQVKWLSTFHLHPIYTTIYTDPYQGKYPYSVDRVDVYGFAAHTRVFSVKTET